MGRDTGTYRVTVPVVAKHDFGSLCSVLPTTITTWLNFYWNALSYLKVRCIFINMMHSEPQFLVGAIVKYCRQLWHVSHSVIVYEHRNVKSKACCQECCAGEQITAPRGTLQQECI